MNWQLIIKDASTQPESGTYSDWKEQIAKECFYQCIYCSINEAQFGGIDHYHIEHYRPKSLEQFKKFENDITNLYYCCPICNRFKSNDWPDDPDSLEIICYPDPSIHNYSDLFDFSEIDYSVVGLYCSTKYITERLYLNRPQLLYERREELLRKKENNITKELETIRKSDEFNNNIIFLNEYLDLISKLRETLMKRPNIRPYKLAEIRK